MDYKAKIKYAEKVAAQIEAQTSLETIKSALKDEGLYDSDVSKVVNSAKKILGEKYQPKIKEYLLEDKDIHGAEEFKLIDPEILDNLIALESRNIALQEKSKITKLMRAGMSAEEAYEQTNTAFLPSEVAVEHITKLEEIKRQNSGGGRLVNIFGGVGLIELTGILLITANRLFYFLPIIGLVMIVRGLTTKKME